MSHTKDTEQKLTSFTHDLFLENEYLEWRKDLKSLKSGKWHSLIVSLDKYNISLNEIKKFSEPTVSKLVFNYVEAPDYNESKILMVQFTVSESMWHSLIWHCPELN